MSTNRDMATEVYKQAQQDLKKAEEDLEIAISYFLIKHDEHLGHKITEKWKVVVNAKRSLESAYQKLSI